MNLTDLLGLHPDDTSLVQYISSLSASAARDGPVIPEIKSYSDAVYFNYFALGLSLLFSPTGRYKPSSGANSTDLKTDKLILDNIYIYNIPKQSDSRKRAAFATYPISPITLIIKPKDKDAEGNAPSRPPQLDVSPETAGKHFVAALGEPDRKGGGAGPSSGSIGIWCEWSKDGVMVEFGGDEAQGPQAWERGKDAIWKILTVFSPAQ